MISLSLSLFLSLLLLCVPWLRYGQATPLISVSKSHLWGQSLNPLAGVVCFAHINMWQIYAGSYEFLMCTPPLSLPFAIAQGWLNHWGSLGEKDGEWERLYFGGRERRMRLVFSSFVLENNDTQSNLNVSSGPEMLSLWLEVKICYWSDLSQGQFNSCSVVFGSVRAFFIKTGLTVDLFWLN